MSQIPSNMKQAKINRLIFGGFLLAVWLVLSNPCLAQSKKTELQSLGLKGRVKTVEEYTVFYSQPTAGGIKKSLRAIYYFDPKGRLVESVQLVDQGDKSYYNRYKNGFDKKGRRISEETFVSSKGKLSEIFLPDSAKTGVRSLNPRLTEKLELKITREFNSGGDVSRETIINALEDVTLKIVYVYDKNGDVSAFTSKNGAPPVLEFKSVYRKDKRRMETVFYENAAPGHQDIFYYDRKKRLLYREQFNFRNPDGSVRKEALAFRTTETRHGDRRETELLSFDESGYPETRSVHFYQDERQTSQIVYKAQTDGKRDWFVFYETKTDYEFDESGSWTKSTVFKREASTADFYEFFTVERKIFYYRR